MQQLVPHVVEMPRAIWMAVEAARGRAHVSFADIVLLGLHAVLVEDRLTITAETTAMAEMIKRWTT